MCIVRHRKDYWTEAIVITTSNNSFYPTEISPLENRFYTLVTDANRYVVKNGNDPTLGNITEEKESELEEIIEYAKFVMGTYGHKVFKYLTKEKTKCFNRCAEIIAGKLYARMEHKRRYCHVSCAD